MAPSRMKVLPKISSTAGIAAPAFCVSSWAMASLSTIAAPSLANSSATVLLPLPIPPVRPTTSRFFITRGTCTSASSTRPNRGRSTRRWRCRDRSGNGSCLRSGRARRTSALRRRRRGDHGENLDRRVLGADWRLAARAFTAQYRPAHERDVLQRSDLVPARRASRARHEQVVRLGLRDLLTGERRALGAPLALEHLRQAVDDDVEERADAEPEQQDDPGKHARLSEPAERTHRLLDRLAHLEDRQVHGDYHAAHQGAEHAHENPPPQRGDGPAGDVNPTPQTSA